MQPTTLLQWAHWKGRFSTDVCRWQMSESIHPRIQRHIHHICSLVATLQPVSLSGCVCTYMLSNRQMFPSFAHVYICTVVFICTVILGLNVRSLKGFTSFIFNLFSISFLPLRKLWPVLFCLLLGLRTIIELIFTSKTSDLFVQDEKKSIPIFFVVLYVWCFLLNTNRTTC